MFGAPCFGDPVVVKAIGDGRTEMRLRTRPHTEMGGRLLDKYFVGESLQSLTEFVSLGT